MPTTDLILECVLKPIRGIHIAFRSIYLMLPVLRFPPLINTELHRWSPGLCVGKVYFTIARNSVNGLPSRVWWWNWPWIFVLVNWSHLYFCLYYVWNSRWKRMSNNYIVDLYVAMAQFRELNLCLLCIDRDFLYDPWCNIGHSATRPKSWQFY